MAPTPYDPEESGVLRPRALRALDHHVDRPHLAMDRTPSSISSGRSTPVPEDAPPSVHSISIVRKQVRAQAKQRIFHNIDYQPRLSHFDPKSDHHWTWTAQVFLTLHTLTFLMKMHSYAFYNGHLSETERRLSALDEPEVKPLPVAVHYPRSPIVANGASMANTETDSTDTEIDPKQQVNKLRADLATELTSPLGQVTYPQNLTYSNYLEFMLFPTLCYELEYPRTTNTRWIEVLIKAAAVFGCIFLLTLTSEEFIVPVLSDSALRLRVISSHFERGLILAETISMLLFPFMVTFLLVFLVIFEYILGAFAEITRFADRRFYSDWWNSCDWLEFSRKWNLPVHHFLRRHVYFSSLTRFSVPGAMAITFLVSSIAHELVMVCITKKWRGYGFFAMMMQLPIVAVQRSKFVKGRKTFNVSYVSSSSGNLLF
ncbi:sterol o-acyltransferase [Arthroderma uncinatum]|uniref:sterol o-acyltransferase n=1 Tax=Arthroderma uncinatum TaxID=74035 RepID=UPI00144AD660|nr:sterol o-acyltransferase [Arthroderma uncinatum]KAF3491599.1 sterol o-acyltransferase [Arthroderma uncinatum]